MSTEQPKKTSPADYGITDAIPTGPGTWMTFVVNQEENEIGIIEWHTCLDEVKGCGVYFDTEHGRKTMPDRSRWTVESRDPLTLSPSILCKRCGHHGYIRNGQWVSA